MNKFIKNPSYRSVSLNLKNENFLNKFGGIEEELEQNGIDRVHGNTESDKNLQSMLLYMF